MRKTLTPREACEILHVSRRTLYRYEQAGLITPSKLNKRKFIFVPEDIEELLVKFKGGVL